ncbi:MAG: mechanosensitive ion channel family protein [Halobacteriales archaeon]
MPSTNAFSPPSGINPVSRLLGSVAIGLAIVLVVVAAWVGRLDLAGTVLDGWQVAVVTLLGAGAVAAGSFGLYRFVIRFAVDKAVDKRRRHDLRNLLRLVFGLVAVLVTFGIVTRQWLGVLVSLGVIGFAVTFALQQPLFSLIGWVYIMFKRPYAVGDRVAIEDAKGDVVEVDFFVTTLWEVGGELVSTHQPSGRIITVPNSVVLSSHVYNYSWKAFPRVWNELSIQVAYETDLGFAVETMVAEADDYLGDEMAEHIGEYRERLAETPVDLEVADRPSVNVVQRESWVELRLRYLVPPRGGQRVRNTLYDRILAAFNDHPDRVKFPVGRNR